MGEAATAAGDVAAKCANCGAPLAGAFCAGCGQAAQEGRPPTVGHFLHDLTHEILHVDGKIFRSVRALFFAPGLLTAEYWSGHIVQWVRPIRLFLIAAAVHLLLATGTGPMNLKFEAFRRVDNARLSLAATIRGAAPDPARLPLPENERQRISERFERTYLAIRYLSPVLFALVTWAVFRRRQPYFVRHLIAGLHFYAVWYLLAAVFGQLGSFSPIFAVTGLVASALYLLLTLRRLYGQRWVMAIASTILLFATLMGIETALTLIAMSVAITDQQAGR